MTQIRQPTQVFNSESYDDQTTVSQAAFEPASGASNIQVDLNNLRTQVNNILNALNGNWWDNPFAGGGGAGGTNDIPVSGDPATQVSLNTVPIACFADVLTDVTVDPGNNFVVLSVAGSEAPSQPGSLSNDTEGVIVAESALSGAPWETNELTERAGSSDIAPNNLVTVRDAATLQPIQSGGRDVFALIQVENGFANGTAFTDVTPQRVKLSFVRINAAGDDLEACPVADIENTDINYNYPFVTYFKNIDPSCFTGSRSFVDQAASVDVTLQNAYVGGNTITTSAGEGNVTITGDQDFIVSGSVDVDVNTTGAVSIDADAASNLTVDGAQLDVATTTSGDLNVSSAGVLNLDSATQTDVQSAGGVINVGTDAVATAISIGNATGASAVTIAGGTGTHSISTQNAATAGPIMTMDNGGSTIGFFAGAGDPNGTVNAGGNVGSLYAETAGGQLWVNTDGATTWVQFGSAASVTLEQATENTGSSPATLGGTSGVTTFETQIQDGNTMSWETTASEELLAVVADAGGDIVRIGNGTGDTLDVNTANVDIDTNDYDMQSTGNFLVRGGAASTIETTAQDLTIQTTGPASAINIQTTNTTAALSPINITAADNNTGPGNNVTVTAGAGGGLSQSGGGVSLNGGAGGAAAGPGGVVEATGGDGAATGNGGAVTFSGGLGGATSGNGGAASLLGGDAQTSGDGGLTTVAAGDGVDTGTGGALILSSGDGGATGNGGAIQISGGDGGATSGSAAGVTINAGSAPTTGNGGSVTITAGGSGNNLPGQINFNLNATGTTEADNIVQFNNPGTDGESFSIYAGTSDPSGVVTALTGSIWSRDDGATGELYLNTSAGGVGTTWEQVATGAVTVSLQAAYDGGNTIVTTGATDIDFSGAVGDGGFLASMGDAVLIQSTGATGTAPPPFGAGTAALIGAEAGTFVGTTDTAGTGNVSILTNGTGLSLPTSTDSGNVSITTGDTTGTGESGTITLQTGASENGSGGIGIRTGAIGAGDTGPSGDVLIETGNAAPAGTNAVAGNIQIAAGSSDATGDAASTGLVNISGGGNNGTDRGGDVNLTGGSNSNVGAGDGGRINISGGQTGGTGAAGDVNITGGLGVATGPGGDVIVSGGDNSTTGAVGDVIVQGGTPTDAAGGNVFISGTNGAGTNQDGGSVTLTSGDPTGTGAHGIISFSAATAGLSDPVYRMDRAGASGVTIDFYNGSVDPETNVTANQGDIYFRDGGGSGAEVVYVKGTGDGTNTGWIALAAAGLGNSLQQAYVAGNTIVTSAAEGDLDFSGTEQFLVDMDSGVSIRGAGTSVSVVNDNTSGTGSALFGTGTTTGGNASGSTSLVSGDGGSGSDTGAVAVNSGNITNGAGTTGPVTVQSGNAIITATGSTGPVTIQSGTSTAASAGTVTVSPGNSGAGPGAALSLSGGAGDSTGGNVNITGGASSNVGDGGNVLITGGAPTSGNGGNVLITGEDAVGTNEDGGNITFTPGAATGTGNDGVVAVLSSLDNTSPAFVLNNSSGTDGNQIGQYVSETQPETVIAAPAGSVCYVDNGGTDTDGELWLKLTGTGNTGWEQVSTSSSALTRDFVQGVASANVTAGNDVSNDAPASNVTMDFGSFPTFPTPQAAFNTRVQVWVNGVLQRNGVTVTLGTNPTDLQFNFQIFSGDIIQIQQWSA